MSQTSVANYFPRRKRLPSEELQSKTKVLVLDSEQVKNSSAQSEKQQNSQLSEVSTSLATVSEDTFSEENSSLKLLFQSKDSNVEALSTLKRKSVMRKIVFDPPKSETVKSSRMPARMRTRTRKLSSEEGQTDIRLTLRKRDDNISIASKNVPFEKKGSLSPKKRSVPSKEHITPKKEDKSEEKGDIDNESISESVTPKKTPRLGKFSRKELNFTEIKDKINHSSRIAEIRASIAKINECDQELGKLQVQKTKEENRDLKPKLKTFDEIELELPVSPSKTSKTPTKTVISPMKNAELLKMASPQRRLLFEPKESLASPVKASPTKATAYQRYLPLAESTTALTLPYNYRFLAEAFRCIDTVAAMLFNRKETISMRKLKPAVQELLRRNFTLDHIAQIKTVYPDAFIYRQEKIQESGSTSRQSKYDLVLIPNVESKNGRNTPDADNVLKSGSETSMGPSVLLERRRNFYNALLDRVKDQHEHFLQTLETPLVVPKEKLVRWHPDFDIEACEPIDKSHLPQPPEIAKTTSAKDILDKAKTLFSYNERIEKALHRIAETNVSPKVQIPSTDSEPLSKFVVENEASVDGFKKVQVSVVNTLSDTPTISATTSNGYVNSAFRGIPKALLERVRAKQAAKALEAMTRSPAEDKETKMHSRLPEVARILRNIFVAEKKNVLSLEFVSKKLDNSYRLKLTSTQWEEHIRLLCKIFPAWVKIQNVRMIDYVRIVKDIDMDKVMRKLESVISDRVKT